MIDFHEGLRDLFDGILNNNSYEIIFDVALYKTDEIRYYKDEDDTDGYGVTRKQVVPVTIPTIIGDYINIPNISVTTNTIALEFDLFLGDYQELEYEIQDRYKSVDYSNTLMSIEQLRKELLAQYHPLGDKYLRFGGSDSKAYFSLTTSYNYNFIYFKGKLEDGTENILNDGTLAFLSKDDNNIYLKDGSDTLSVQYSAGEVNEIIAYVSGGVWNLHNLTNNTSDTGTSGNLISLGRLDIGYDTGFTGQIDTLALDTTSHTTYTKNGGYAIELYEFDSKETFTNKGEGTISAINKIENCILWGSSGNAVFGLETLYPVSDIMYVQGMPYQTYRTEITALVSNDVLFGNNFEYYLVDGSNEYQVYPLDRNHTYAGVTNSAHKLNKKFATTIIESNDKELTHTFFYNGSRDLTDLMRQVTKNDQEQNKTYNLRIQYPFYQDTYDVVIDTGGMTPNINDLATFSVTYKQKDENVT